MKTTADADVGQVMAIGKEKAGLNQLQVQENIN